MFKDKNFKLLFWLSVIFGFIIPVAIYVFNLVYMRGLLSKDGLQTAVFANIPIFDYIKAASMGVAVSTLCLGAMDYGFRRYLVLVVPVVLYNLLYFIWISISNILQGFSFSAHGGLMLFSTLSILTVITLPVAVYLLSKATKHIMPVPRYFLIGILSIIVAKTANVLFSTIIMLIQLYIVYQKIIVGSVFSYFFNQQSIYSLIIQCIGFIVAFFFLQKRFLPMPKQEPESI